MKNKRIILILLFCYSLITSFLYVKNVVLAKEQTSVVQTIIEKEDIQSEDSRAALRAFYTAPPVIPHDIESQDAQDCLRCHMNVTNLEDGRVAMQTPHPQFTNCMQCHVPTKVDEFNQSSTQWEGLKEPKRGDRWFTMSPPTVPHRIKLREDCLSCHGPENPDLKMRTPHPERTSCLQCHVPNYANEFVINGVEHDSAK